MRSRTSISERKRIFLFPMNYNLLIITVLLGGMGITGASIAVAVAKRDVVVVENAYETGLQYDQMRKRTEELGWKVDLPRSVPRSEAGLEMTVRDRANAALPNARVTLRTFRLGTRNQQTYECVSRGEGRYRAPVRFDAAGSWSAEVRVAVKDDIQVFENTISVQ